MANCGGFNGFLFAGEAGTTEIQTSTPIAVVRVPPAEGAQMPLPPIKAPLPSPLPPEEPSPMPSPLEDASPLPVVAPLRFPPRAITLSPRTRKTTLPVFRFTRNIHI